MLLPYQQVPILVLFFFKQVDESMVIYEHTNTEATGWNAQDYFTFTVSSPPAVLGSQLFHINISYDLHDQSSQMLANTGNINLSLKKTRRHYFTSIFKDAQRRHV